MLENLKLSKPVQAACLLATLSAGCNESAKETAPRPAASAEGTLNTRLFPNHARPKDAEFVRVSSDQIADMLQAADRTPADLHEKLSEDSAALALLQAQRAEYYARCGTPQQPFLSLADSFHFQPPLQNAPPPPEINELYLDKVWELREQSALLCADLHLVRTLSEQPGAADSFSDIPPLPLPDPSLRDLMPEQAAEELKSDPKLGNAALIMAMVEAGQELLEAGSSPLDAIHYNQDIAELGRVAPELLEEAVCWEDIKPLLDPVLSRVLNGYPQHLPKIVVHASAAEFQALEKTDSNSAGVHNAFHHRIACYRGSKLDLSIILAHEIGHALVRISEEEVLQLTDGLEAACSARAKLAAAAELLKQKASALEADRPVASNDWEEIRTIEYDLLKQRQALWKIDLAELVAHPPSRQHTTEVREEAGAMLFADVVMHELARTHPAYGAPLQRIHNIHTRFAEGTAKREALRMADELKAEANGDALAALKRLMTPGCTLPQCREELDVSLEWVTHKLNRLKLEDRLSEELGRRRQQFKNERNRPEYLTALKTRIITEQARVAELSQELLGR